jgi:hypothetical protein
MTPRTDLEAHIDRRNHAKRDMKEADNNRESNPKRQQERLSSLSHKDNN